MELQGRRSVVFVLGLPGAGKGTVCRRLAQKYSFEHVDIEDLFRREASTEGSVYGPVLRTLGRDVPSEVGLELLKYQLAKSMSGTFLVDGFPKNLNLLTGWNTDVGDKFSIAFVLFLDCPSEICRMRIVKRAEQGEGKLDEHLLRFFNRKQRFDTDTMAVIKHFYNSKAVVKVDSRASPDLVFQEVDRVFQAFFGLPEAACDPGNHG